LVALVLIWQAWSTVGGLSGSPLAIARGWWEGVAGEWRFRLLIRDSDWVTLVLESTPAWMHVPFAVLLGLIHPFLPAAIAGPGNPLWQAISIWRSLGWYLLLPFLLYAPWAAVRKGKPRSVELFLALLVWLTAILASLRASSYQWDSPRYRAVFLAAQAALAGWAWVHARRTQSPWLGRVAAVTGFSVLAALQWYLGRYYDTPSLGLPQTLALILLGSILLLAGGWVRDRARSGRNPP
jgi:peptidoglycan/LPS O-acetylase OafA/YrhL